MSALPHQSQPLGRSRALARPRTIGHSHALAQSRALRRPRRLPRHGFQSALQVATAHTPMTAVVGMTAAAAAAALAVATLSALVLSALLAPAPANAVGWRWQNPLPQGNDLNGTCFVDAKHGWAVGDAGTILVTSNGGVTWKLQQSGTANDLEDIVFLDRKTGYACGDLCTIVSTTNGGVTWRARELDARHTLNGIDFVDKRRGWAVGCHGHAVYTRDGGAHWKWMDPGERTILHDVDFVDAKRGWAVGWYGQVLVTTDGGAHWSQQSAGTRDIDQLNGVCFTDAEHGWVVGDYTLIATTDGGKNWVPQTSWNNLDNYYTLRDVCFVDQLNGWAVGGGGLILHTTTGGGAWHEQTSGVSTSISGVAATDASCARAVGGAGMLLTADDGGTRWQMRSSGATGNLKDVCFSDAQHGWAVGTVERSHIHLGRGADTGVGESTVGSAAARGLVQNRGQRASDWPVVVLTTSDGGGHWSVQYLDQPTSWARTPLAVAFSGTKTGWLVGDDSLLMGTTDGGATWVEQNPLDFQFTSFTDITCAGSGRFVAVGRDYYTGVGMIAITADDGNWIRGDDGSLKSLSAVTFADAATGWVVGGGGTIARTATGGVTWAVQTSGTTEALLGVDFVDVNTGWAVGAKGTILVTHNGGQTWSAQKSGVEEHLVDVAFVDVRHGWVLVADGTVLATINGGATWRRQHSALGQTAGGMTFLDGKLGWIAASGGSILRYDPSPPVATARATTLRRGRSGTIAVKLTNRSGGPDQVWATIAIYKGSKRVKRIESGWRAGNATVNVRYRPTLPPGVYMMKLTAVDRFGNQQADPSSARLTIR